MKKLCVFGGASFGENPRYREAVEALGKEIAGRNIMLVYGGGKSGLMGLLADTVLAHGGSVIGVIPKLLEKEAHHGLTELRLVDNIEQRKQEMVRLADGFIAYPGGIGTMEEIFEVWNGAKIGVHNKTTGLLNTANFFNPLLMMADHLVTQGFLSQSARHLLKDNENPAALIDMVIKPEKTAGAVDEKQEIEFIYSYFGVSPAKP